MLCYGVRPGLWANTAPLIFELEIIKTLVYLSFDEIEHVHGDSFDGPT